MKEIVDLDSFKEKNSFKNNKALMESIYLPVSLDFANFTINDLMEQKRENIELTNEKLESLTIALTLAYLSWYESKCKEEEYNVINCLKSEIYKMYAQNPSRLAGGRL